MTATQDLARCAVIAIVCAALLGGVGGWIACLLTHAPPTSAPVAWYVDMYSPEGPPWCTEEPLLTRRASQEP